jgi:hypothetical protein
MELVYDVARTVAARQHREMSGMDERVISCADGTRWKVDAPGRTSFHRIELVFESLDEPGTLLRGEVAAAGLSELSDAELCFLLEELRL